MGARKIQIGQLWKKKGTGDTFLVTRVYNEALSTFVVLRKSGSEGEDLVRGKAERTAEGQGLPGFVPAGGDESGQATSQVTGARLHGGPLSPASFFVRRV